MVFDHEWPSAVTVATTTLQKIKRARYIANDFFKVDKVGKKILDFGSGDGTVSEEMASSGATVCAFDPVPHVVLEKATWCYRWEEAYEHRPFDHVLMYDTIDHLVSHDYRQALGRVRSVLSPTATVWVRAHPWCSRWGNHFPPNRAFAHLILSPEDMLKMRIIGIPTVKVVDPLNTYSRWFTECGFKIETFRVHVRPVEGYFLKYKAELARHWKSDAVELRNGIFVPFYYMGIEFVDYVLRGI